MLAFDGDKKRIELLHDAVPGAHTFAFIADEAGITRKDEYRRAAENIGVEIVSFEAKSPADRLWPRSCRTSATHRRFCCAHLLWRQPGRDAI
jgi:hypothetical protein